MPLKAIPINCTLKKSGGKQSSTDAMIAVLKAQFAEHDVEVNETLRMADFNILPGVTSDEGEGDDWPRLREQILAHDILIFGGPIWLGQIGSIAKRGWFVDLGIDSAQNGNPTAAGERFIGHPLLQNGILFFATYTPKSAGTADCEVGGSNTLYGMDSLSGAAQMQDVRTHSANGAPAGDKTTNAIELLNGGTAPITNLVTYLTSGSGPATDPGGPENPPTTRCSAVIQAPGAPSLYMPRPCGRQSWRQIR